MHELIAQLRDTQKILLDATDIAFKRFLYSQIDFSQRLIGIVGPRGVGKTTLILQYVKEHYRDSDKALYLLADSVLFRRGDLLTLAREFYFRHEGELICIDEIHRYENWNQELKNVYDTLPGLKVIFTGSSSLNLVKGKYDLSRRGVLYQLPGLSFREYLALSKGMAVDVLPSDKLLRDPPAASSRLASRTILKEFSEYLEVGYYPFFRETRMRNLYYQQVLTTIDKVVYEDIASCYQLKTENLTAFKQILSFLATISPGEVNVHKLARSIGKNDATAAAYLEIMREAGLVRFLSSNKAGHALVRHAKKVFVDNPNLLFAMNHAMGKQTELGTLRELFALNQLQNAGSVPLYTNEGDIEVDGMVFEIGGKGKRARPTQKNSYRVLDDILAADRTTIPLYLFGFLY